MNARKLASACVDYPFVVLTAMVLVSYVSLVQLVDFDTRSLQLGIDSSVESLLPASGPAIDTYAAVREQFVGDDLLVVLWQAKDLFSPEGLAGLQRVTEGLAAIDGVARVDGLANAKMVRVEDDFTSIDEFLAELPETLDEAHRLREEAVTHPMYVGQLVSRDGYATMLAVHFAPGLDSDATAAVVDRVAALSAEEAAAAGGIEQFITGPAVARLETARTLFSDIRVVFPLAILATVCVSAFGLRSTAGVVLPLLANAVALLVTMALFIRTGHALNFVTVIMPPVVFVVGFAYAVHVVSDFQHAYSVLGDKLAAVKTSLQEVFVPLTLTAFTTSIGFASLATSNIETIKTFGLYSALGTLLSWVAAVTVVPLGLRFMPASAHAGSEPGFLLRAAPRIAQFDLENRNAILAGGLLLGLVGLALIPQIKVGTDYLRNFPADSEIRAHFDDVSARFAGVVPVQVLIETDIPDNFKNPGELRELDELQKWLNAQPEIGGSLSFVDYMRMLHQAFNPEVEFANALPGSFNLADQLLAFSSSEDASVFIDPRYRSTLIHVRSSAVSSSDLGALIRRIENRLRQLPAHMRGTVTGSSVLVARTMDDITRGQVLSLSGALLVIYLILATLFGSLRVGAIALIPNLLPIILFFGVLALTGITLNLATSLVATIALGIAVDDSIHYFSRFNAESRRLANEQLGVQHAVAAVIRPVTFTTAALSAGFLALVFSALRNQVEFGVLAAITLVLAWLIDLTISPALSSGLRFVTLWEVLALDLGQEPHKKIPLFKGLTHRQARIAALFGRIEAYTPGDRIITAGEEGREICIIVEGTVAARVTRDEGDVTLREMHPGSVMGEVALFTGKRTAHIDAVDNVRVLWLNQESLERIESRYPKIASRIFWNLTGTVAERLADVTERL